MLRIQNVKNWYFAWQTPSHHTTTILSTPNTIHPTLKNKLLLSKTYSCHLYLLLLQNLNFLTTLTINNLLLIHVITMCIWPNFSASQNLRRLIFSYVFLLSIWKLLIVNFQNYEVLTKSNFAPNITENEN